MKKQIIVLLLIVFLPALSSAKRIKPCALDQRPLSERKADYEQFVHYKSGYSEANVRGIRFTDQILFNGEVLLIDYSPLCDFKGISRALVQDNAPFTKSLRKKRPSVRYQDDVPMYSYGDPNFGSKRDFLAKWTIVNDSLFLKDIYLNTKDIDRYWLKTYLNMDTVSLAKLSPPQQEIYQRLEKATGRKFDPVNHLIFADWFSGELIAEPWEPNDSTRNRWHRTGQTALIQVEKGKVASIQFKELKELQFVGVRPMDRAVFPQFEEALATWGRKFTFRQYIKP